MKKFEETMRRKALERLKASQELAEIFGKGKRKKKKRNKK
jgi:hypothetical protein